MKRFLIGLAIGVALGGTGTYTLVKDKLKKVATIENAATAIQATQEYGETIQGIFN